LDAVECRQRRAHGVAQMLPFRLGGVRLGVADGAQVQRVVAPASVPGGGGGPPVGRWVVLRRLRRAARAARHGGRGYGVGQQRADRIGAQVGGGRQGVGRDGDGGLEREQGDEARQRRRRLAHGGEGRQARVGTLRRARREGVEDDPAADGGAGVLGAQDEAVAAEHGERLAQGELRIGGCFGSSAPRPSSQTIFPSASAVPA
jgi:hypothetical protein